MKDGRPLPAFGVLLVLVVAVSGGVWEVQLMGGAAAAAPSAAQCHQERALAITACAAVIYGGLPTPQCCQRARVSNIECICAVVTPKLAAAVGGVRRAVRLIEGCGRRVPRHYKCGGITTP